MRIGSELGGSMTIEFITYKLRRGESFIIFIDAKEVANIKVGKDKDSHGYSKRSMEKMTFDLEKGDHLIQFSVESRLEPDLISNYFDTQY